MPDYDFTCEDCKETFTIHATVKEREEGLACPHCGSKNLEQLFTGFNIVGGESSCFSCDKSEDSFFGGG